MYNSRNLNLYVDIIHAQSSKIITLPFDAPVGDAFVPEQMICNCVIIECITTIINSRRTLKVYNPTDKDIILSLDHSVSADVLNMECDTLASLSSRTRYVTSRL